MTDQMPEKPALDLRRVGRKLIAARVARMDALYSGQHYTIVKRVELTGGQKFRTPFGHLGSSGYVLVNDDPAALEAGGDIAKHIVGGTLLKRIANEYGAVEIPPKRKPGRPDQGGNAKAKAHAAAQLASEEILMALAADSADEIPVWGEPEESSTVKDLPEEDL